MFGVRIAQCSRLIASASTQRAPLHISAVLLAQSDRKRQARNTKKLNITKRDERHRLSQANRPHVVLGIRPGNEHKWDSCDLAKVLVNEAELVANTELTPIEHPLGTISVPQQLNYGVGEEEKETLLKILPSLSAEAEGLRAQRLAMESAYWATTRHDAAERIEMEKASNFAKALDLRNANAGGIAYENRRRIIKEFSEPTNPTDTGRPEVQAALLTFKIRKLWTHLTRFKRDVGNRLSLRKLVHQRAKILKYLKRLDRDRYEAVLERLALEPESVEGELVV